MDKCPHETSRAEARARLELSDEERLLVVPSRMVRDGGHRIALWARGMLCMIDPGIHICLPVGGPMLPRVRHFARGSSPDGRAILPDHAPPLETVYRAADVAVLLPCKPTAVSTPALLDAGRAGLPLVATDLPPVRAVYTDGHDALLVKPNCARSAAAAILRILDEPELARALAANARAKALRNGECPCPPTC